MLERKIEAESKMELLGKTEVKWKIAGYSGQLSHVVRSTAECFVNIPTGDNNKANTQLRFHLKPNRSQQEPETNLCKLNDISQERSFTSNQKPSQAPDKLPEKLLSGRTTQSASYSLLLDVLGCSMKKSILVVSWKNDEESNAVKSNFVVLDSNTPQQNILVDEHFDHKLDSINVEKFTQQQEISQDATWHLKVEAYKLFSTGTDAPAPNDVTENSETPPNKFLKLGDETSDVTLTCSDGVVIQAHKSVLTGKSEYCRRELETTTELFLSFESEPMLLLINWMYTNTLNLDYAQTYLEIICSAAKAFELNPGFWKYLELNLTTLFTPSDLFTFLRVVETYDLKTPPGFLEKIECIKKKVKCEPGKYDDDDGDLEKLWNKYNKHWEFNRKWCAFDELSAEVNYPSIKFANLAKHEKAESETTDQNSILETKSDAKVEIVIERSEKRKASDILKPGNEKKHKANVKPWEETPDVILRSSNGMLIHAHKNVLTEKSAYFRHNSEVDGSGEMFVPVNGEPLLLLLHWMYKGELPTNLEEQTLDGICVEARKLEIGAEFWKWLAANLTNYVSNEAHNFSRIVTRYNLTIPSDVKEKLDYIQKTLGKLGSYSDSYKHYRRWRTLENLLKEVNYLTVEFGSELR